MAKNISSKEEALIKQYAFFWWTKYCQFVDTHYYEIRHLFEYYQGANLVFVISKSMISSDVVDTKSGVMLFEIKYPSQDGLNTEIDKKVYDIYFFELDDSCSVIGTMGYTSKIMVLDEIHKKGIEASIKQEIESELLNIIKTNDSLNFFDSFVNLVLGLHGYNKYIFGDCYLKSNLSQAEHERVTLVKYTKNHEIKIDEMKSAIDKNSNSQIIFAYDGVFSFAHRNAFSKDDKVIMLDLLDLFRKLRYILYESTLSAAVLNEFIKPMIGELKLDNAKIKQSKLAETLISDLKNCPTGQQNWKEYESICYKAMSYLFEDSFILLSNK